ncbi:MAG TPA: MFS transporter [Terriglobales bacterium]|nr:MFS transporter [Terriglobales bacterium]
MQPSRNLVLLYGAALLRSASIGLLGVLLAVYLSRTGFSPTAIGFVLAAGLVGSAAATAAMSRYGNRFSRKQLLIAAAVLSAMGGIGLAFVHVSGALVPVASLCMLNGMGTDRSAAFAVEQALIPSLVADRSRTWALSWYNVVLDTSGALGALAGALPVVIHNWAGIDLLQAYKPVFFFYTALNLVSAALYLFLDSRVELSARGPGEAPQIITPATKHMVRRISALFALDSAGGGFLADALLAYWFFHRFGVKETGLGLLFFVVRILNGLSHLGAAWLAGKIGLVRTMVFTHLPSSLFLLAVPLAPSFGIAAVLLLMREALVEMDVPTRQSYVAAVVQPHERVYASSVTNLTRTGAWAVTASVSGALMQHVAFSAPLVLGGAMKVIYDLLLYRSFRHVRPPEEQRQGQTQARIRPA